MYVTGQSGVGKTTIVEEVYEKLQTNNHFGVLLCFPPDMSVIGIRQLIDNLF
jgi:molybdopterin-guanine dinucleotide biosynthesis protein